MIEYVTYRKQIFLLNIVLTQKQMFLRKRTCHLPVSLSEEEIERRKLLEREWSSFKKDQWSKDVKVMKSIMVSQEIALKELKAVSKQLYKKAVEVSI